MKPGRISRYSLMVLFISSCALIFFLIALTFRNSQEMQEEGNWVYHSADVISSVEKIYDEAEDLQLKIQGNDSLSIKNEAADFCKKTFAGLAELAELVRDNPGQSENVKRYAEAVADYAKNIQKSTKSKGNSKLLFKKIQNYRNQIVKSENILLKQRRDSLSSSISSFPVFIYLLSVFSLFIISYAFYQLNKEFKRQSVVNKELTLAKNTAELAEKLGNFGVWQFNPEKNELKLSKNLASIFETNKTLILHKDEFWSKVHQDDAKKLRTAMERLIAGNPTQPITYRFLRKDGSYLHIHTDAVAMPTGDGGNMLLGVSADISEITQDRNSLQAANEDLNFYNESSKTAEVIGNYGFWRWSSRTEKFWFSDNLYRIFGVESGVSFSEFAKTIHPEDREMVETKVRMMYNGTEFDEFEHRIIRKCDGKLRYVMIRSSKILKNDGEFMYIIITQDITDQKQQTKTIEQKNLELEEANKELTAFNYIASHDLQEPLRKIETFISRIKIPDEEEGNNKTYILKIAEMAKKMRGLISDLLKFSRNSKQDEAFETADLNEILLQSIEDAKQKYETSAADFDIQKLPAITMIPFQVRQLFSNLIQNSLKYRSKDKTPKIKVKSSTVKAQEDEILKNAHYDNFCKITFRDNGIGFDNQYAEKIFDLFARLHSKAEYEGTGIGLAICKKIMNNHHGYISASSSPGIGTEFQIYFPIV